MSRRLRVEVHGAVQGVGFRPFVYRLAHELSLTGWVENGASGVTVEVEGSPEELESFRTRLESERPPLARVQEVEEHWVPTRGERRFEIRESSRGEPASAAVLPDVATCPDCLAEIVDPSDRRFRYPFGNCTRCGPRFTIVRDLPYDRARTTMSRFVMCPECREEYEDPRDRRFHAQPTACPACGPRLTLRSPEGDVLATDDEALRDAAEALGRGWVVALKGLGGYQLLCDARDETAVKRLREAKGREEKPFAILVRNLLAAEHIIEPTGDERAALSASEAPIVLVAKRPESGVADAVAPGRPDLGVMLPATPLHHLLCRALDFPLVATSGNLSDEPIAIDEREARASLRGVADFFLDHDRPIERHADDSVVRVVEGAPRLLRRARGYAPLPVLLREAAPPLLAVGGQMKATVALSVGRQVFVSQHLGDLETPEALAVFERVIADFSRLYGALPVAVAHDLHPNYASTRWAEKSGFPLVAVQHHHAHLASCLADAGVEGPALGVTWDGTGYGTDGTVWGGEFLLGDARSYTRVASLFPFRLPGGETAVREGRRAALGILFALGGEELVESEDSPAAASFPRLERRVLARMLASGTNAPLTTSAGRLFDAVSSLLGVRHVNRFEGQAAMELEALADPAETGAYPLPLREAESLPRLDWRPLVEALLRDVRRGVDPRVSSARFHNALA